ncbi:hypothetical protein IU510_11720 [Nocardia cyriacigeorgica]|uniref:hypothetical protein n=1 Tax=Nocardia cyriacigeorgica TaxID=135487 RepID=UPI00189411DE|nr:hypothetical protein [Nocardia cyriacigeorgica]MBF6098745.1 hypothetical protein [Nocardia cyriacigeorgica]MBF6161937.1 hypothetical protein [Nocardia cyriacigeorgica]MBF6200735.1 hypothetical protein [Nocardia cyriacigeorgica]MBF6317449.1 hypothetical protein [Nocardia cyriacigeorgica]MBF6531999.1 hypothetical protein [Nocardia cyriacigeorgica]
MQDCATGGGRDHSDANSSAPASSTGYGRDPTCVAALLSPAQLLQAIAGRCPVAGPLVCWARELSDLHAQSVSVIQRRELPGNRADFLDVCAQIDRVVAEIDLWASCHIPRMRGARKHTHSLGEVISHFAKTYAEAWWTVLHYPDFDRRHRAWSRLAEVQEGYADLVDQIRARHLQLPHGPAGIPL